MEKHTIFDKILAKQIPATVVYEDDAILAFHDISPQAKVHVLVIPKKRAINFAELADWSEHEIGIFFKGVTKVAHRLGLPKNGFRVVVNNGDHGGQTVHYLHAHILGGEPLPGTFGA